MGYVQPIETEELPLPSDPKWVLVVKKKASRADQLDVELSQTGLQPDTAEAIRAFVVARTLTMIASWNLTDEKDQPLPLSAASISIVMEQEDGAYILAETQRRYQGNPVSAQGPFVTRSSRRSTGTKSATLASPPVATT